MICKECLHIAVCSKYKATGGTDNCKHFMKQNHGRWITVCNNVRKCPNCNKERNTDYQRGWYSCPFCGTIMDLPNITEKTQAALETMDKKTHGGE